MYIDRKESINRYTPALPSPSPAKLSRTYTPSLSPAPLAPWLWAPAHPRIRSLIRTHLLLSPDIRDPAK
jgi:hypothetical protein